MTGNTLNLPRHAAGLLDGVLTETSPVSGGDLAEVWAIGLQDGRRAIVKTGPLPAIEADMLRALRQAGAPAPNVLAVDDRTLVLERLPGGGTLPAAWSDLGSVLRRLHDAPVAAAAGYGWAMDFAFGTLPIVNGWHADWARFWRDHRLLTHVPHIPTTLAHRLEALARHLPDRLPAHPRPVLLHGDLWSGNVLVSQKRISGLIDPACCIGAAEADFAMLTLFARPDAAFWSAYGAFDAGWRERIAIYRLWPALVHLRLFGGSYHGMVSSLLDAIPL